MFTVLRALRVRPSLINSQQNPFRLIPIARRYTSVAEPDDISHYTFVEEALGIPAEAGCGWFQGGPGDTLGPDSRYKLETKLGYGTTSSVWLAQDRKRNDFVAVKILTGYATELNLEDKLQELKALKALSTSKSLLPPPLDGRTHSVQLLAAFLHPGIEEDGRHLCLVTKLLGPDFLAMRNTLPQNGYLPLSIVKRVLQQLLIGIAHAHAHGIAHTDIKPDNIMMDLDGSWTAEAITAWLRDNPPKRHLPERSMTKMVTAFIKQPLPIPDAGLLATATFRLADWGSAQFVSEQSTDYITPLGLRPPEIILESDWDTSVDIWTYGCITFNALANRPLFDPTAIPDLNISREDVALYQMIGFCSQNFSEDFLQTCRRRDEFFMPKCTLIKFKDYFHKPLEACIAACRFGFSTQEITEAAAFIRRCLQFDPRNRASAMDLLQDEWLSS